jgi:hypothetical protein
MSFSMRKGGKAIIDAVFVLTVDIFLPRCARPPKMDSLEHPIVRPRTTPRCLKFEEECANRLTEVLPSLARRSLRADKGPRL